MRIPYTTLFRSEVRHEPERGLETDGAAEGGRDADGATLVAAEGDIDLASGDGRARARRRAAGDVLVVVGVERPAVVADRSARGETAAQAIHDVLADDRAARLEHTGDDRGVEIRSEAFERERHEAHWHAGHRDVVLVADGLAGQQTLGRAGDPALPHPGVERIVLFSRSPSGQPG